MSIKKIAESVGASPATVSRVLNNPEYRCKQPELRDRIWKKAIELNYTPNVAARNLKLGVNEENTATTSVHLLVTSRDNKRMDPFFGESLRVIETEIHRCGCILSNLFFHPVFADANRYDAENPDRIIKDMTGEAESGADGLIIVGDCCKKAFEKLEKAYGNLIMMNRSSSGLPVDEVICDGRKIAHTAVEYLYSLGHRKIGYVGVCKGEVRYTGYLEAVAAHGLDMTPEYVVAAGQTQEDGYKSMMKLLKSEDCPTGIYCANDVVALGVLKALGKYRNPYLRPSIISSDDIEEAQFSKPMLTTIRVPRDEMGRMAVKLLVDRIRGQHKTCMKLELESKLIIRESCHSVGDSMWSDYII